MVRIEVLFLTDALKTTCMRLLFLRLARMYLSGRARVVVNHVQILRQEIRALEAVPKGKIPLEPIRGPGK